MTTDPTPGITFFNCTCTSYLAGAGCICPGASEERRKPHQPDFTLTAGGALTLPPAPTHPNLDPPPRPDTSIPLT